MNSRDALPFHAPAGEEIRPSDEAGGLRVCGLVERPRVLSATELGTLPRVRLAERFVCEEGWAVDYLEWEGIPMREVLAICKPLPEASYLRVGAGPYSVALPLTELQSNQVLVCDRLNGTPLPREHGAPWRLVVSGGACFTSVKWVSTIELAAEPGDATAEAIARGRLKLAHDTARTKGAG